MKEVVITADKIKKRKKFYKRTKLIVFIILLILIFSFIILSIVYNGGRFTVTLDNNFALKSGIILYETEEFQNDQTRKLYAENIDFLDNISIDWLPKDIDNEKDGSHNGENYIAYTFYLENKGERNINYWYSIIIDDVIKNVDEAVRVMIYLNGEKAIETFKDPNFKLFSKGRIVKEPLTEIYKDYVSFTQKFSSVETKNPQLPRQGAGGGDGKVDTKSMSYAEYDAYFRKKYNG